MHISEKIACSSSDVLRVTVNCAISLCVLRQEQIIWLYSTDCLNIPYNSYREEEDLDQSTPQYDDPPFIKISPAGCVTMTIN